MKIKRILAVCLTVVMVMGSIPASGAFASEYTGDIPSDGAEKTQTLSITNKGELTMDHKVVESLNLSNKNYSYYYFVAPENGYYRIRTSYVWSSSYAINWTYEEGIKADKTPGTERPYWGKQAPVDYDDVEVWRRALNGRTRLYYLEKGEMAVFFMNLWNHVAYKGDDQAQIWMEQVPEEAIDVRATKVDLEWEFCTTDEHGVYQIPYETSDHGLNTNQNIFQIIQNVYYDFTVGTDEKPVPFAANYHGPWGGTLEPGTDGMEYRLDTEPGMEIVFRLQDDAGAWMSLSEEKNLEPGCDYKIVVTLCKNGEEVSNSIEVPFRIQKDPTSLISLDKLTLTKDGTEYNPGETITYTYQDNVYPGTLYYDLIVQYTYRDSQEYSHTVDTTGDRIATEGWGDEINGSVSLLDEKGEAIACDMQNRLANGNYTLRFSYTDENQKPAQKDFYISVEPQQAAHVSFISRNEADPEYYEDYSDSEQSTWERNCITRDGFRGIGVQKFTARVLSKEYDPMDNEEYGFTYEWTYKGLYQPSSYDETKNKYPVSKGDTYPGAEFHPETEMKVSEDGATIALDLYKGGMYEFHVDIYQAAKDGSGERTLIFEDDILYVLMKDMVYVEEPATKPTVTPASKPTVTPVSEPAVTPASEPTVPSEQKLTAASEPLEIGKTFVSGNYKYRVTGSKTVAFTGVENKKLTKVVIGNTVKYKNVTYTITSVANKALNKNTKVTQIIVGDKVTSIGKKAFAGCKKLKKLKFGTGVTTIGKNALKGIYAKAKIKVPANKLKAYKKLLKKKGQSSKVKIVK